MRIPIFGVVIVAYLFQRGDAEGAEFLVFAADERDELG